jgi:hypothetical protein
MLTSLRPQFWPDLSGISRPITHTAGMRCVMLLVAMHARCA